MPIHMAAPNTAVFNTAGTAAPARTTAAALPESNSARPEDIQKATREFEAMWIEMMLHSARPEADATLTGESDSTRDMVLDMADQQIAQMLAAQGGMGLSRLVQQGLKKTPSAPAPAAQHGK